MGVSSTKHELNKVIDSEDSTISDYFSLLKPRVMSLAIFTSVIGLSLAPGTLHPFLSFVSIICISLGAGCCAAINMWYDRDIDSKMERTKNRAIPLGKIDSSNVLGFGILLGVTGLILLGLAVSYFAAFLLGFSIFFYIVIYTMWLKRSTHHNIVIGGAAGAFPPVIGWACVTNDISLFPVILFLIIFFWTPPHFWSLALFKDTEYSKVNIPMLPVKYGKKNTKIQILIYSFILFFISSLPYIMNLTTNIYFIVSCFLNLIFVYGAIDLMNSNPKNSDKKASFLFKYSIIYLYILFLSVLFDKNFAL
ncbi:MAG: protoheme IX farnesyltransferase [Rickettsiales bacterium]|nr:protoheme IX farnesyltransferase [Rickettsiales bacterium]OUV53252.1 MAG: protoheme IX farnesyltransferase [Rickettsiales bacterium TMED127]|tara:strand:+ start:24649 stop:25569 length:921 start_codon:yes stop_codon:yes gene_type:complete